MEKFKYESPAISILGTVHELTEEDKPDKCGGSGDFELPQLLKNEFGNPCP